jgi:hypothetical protein
MWLCAAVAFVAMWVAALPRAAAGAGGQLGATFFDARRHPAIQYEATEPRDPFFALAAGIASGRVTLPYDARAGYLPALLRALEIPAESQLAVGSKTSLQSGIISPANPRLIYFNDAVAVAWPRGGFIEIASHDPRLGMMFYTLEQRATPAPRIERSPACLACHVAYASLNVPGMLVRSVGMTAEGAAMPWLANATTDHRTPFEERWSGWVVTGRSGSVRHLGNLTAASRSATGLAARASSLASIPTGGGAATLSPHSDIVALLVFDHQMHMMNLLTRLGWEARVAAADRPADAAGVIARVAAEVVDYMLFVDEARLSPGVAGASGFAATFVARGPRDARGRSLRDFDLERRLFRHPCSYMIYSAAFDALPPEAKAAVYRRLAQVLSGTERDTRYARLTGADRRAIIEILRETKPETRQYLSG